MSACNSTPSSESIQELINEQERISIRMKLLGSLINTSAVEYILSFPKEDRIESARVIYWEFPEVQTTALCTALEVAVHQLTPLMGKWESDVPCCDCGVALSVSSRTELKSKRNSYRKSLKTGVNYQRCDTCRVIHDKETTDQWMQRVRDVEHRLHELKTMSYQDYLMTPEWAEKRKSALKRYRGRCQLCNSSQELNVHHRTYERLGQEEHHDLIVLCHSCHTQFHGMGK